MIFHIPTFLHFVTIWVDQIIIIQLWHSFANWIFHKLNNAYDILYSDGKYKCFVVQNYAIQPASSGYECTLIKELRKCNTGNENSPLQSRRG